MMRGQIKTFVILLAISCQTFAFIGNSIFKTRNPILFNRFNVQNGNELEEIGISTHTHESITINALKRSVITLFHELNSDFQMDSEASLSEIFQ